MKVKCIVCGREFSVPDKRPAQHKGICSIRCEMKYNLQSCRASTGKDDVRGMKASVK